MPFPTTAEFVDAFGPPTLVEDPLYVDGHWAQVDSRPQCRNGGGEANPSQEFAVNYSYWAQEAFQGDAVEVWACTDGGQLGAALETWRVALWMDPINMEGYLLYYGGALSKGFELRYYSGGGDFEGIGGANGGYPTNIGMRINGTQVEAWASYDSGDTWALMVSVTDTRWRGGPWYLGIGLEEQGGTSELAITCFGGGVKNMPQFFRYLRN